jgi:hypothetical protein
VAVGKLWGREALGRIRFDPEEATTPSRFEMFLQPFRH